MLVGMVGLVGVVGVEVRANVRLQRSNDETKQALVQSEESRNQANAVERFLVEAFRRPDPSQDGRLVKGVDILDRATEQLDRGFEGSQATKGALLNALGNTYQGLGVYDRAVSLHTKARCTRGRAGPRPHRYTR